MLKCLAFPETFHQFPDSPQQDHRLGVGFVIGACDNRADLPLLVYAPRGWEIERETYADELLDGINRMLADSNASQDLNWLTEKNPEVLRLVLGKIADTSDAKYLPILKRWQNKATRKISNRICETRRALQPTVQPNS